MINTKEMVSVSEASTDFSKAAQMADQTGRVVLVEGDRPKYLLLDIESDPRLELSEEELINISATRIFRNHRAAFEELAK